MSTNIDFKLQNNSPLIEQQEPEKVVLDNNEDINPSDAVQNEKGTNSVLNKYLKHLETAHKLEDIQHLSLAHLMFCDFFNVLNDENTSEQIESDGYETMMALFVLIYEASTTGMEKEKFNDLKSRKVNELLSIILKSKAYPIYETSIINARDLLINSELSELIFPISTNTKKPPSLSSLTTSIAIVFNIITVTFNAINTSYNKLFIQEGDLLENSKNKLPQAMEYPCCILEIFKNKFLNYKDSLTFNQINDLTKFLEITINNNASIGNELANFNNFYLQKFNTILKEFHTSSSKYQNEMGKELFEYIKEIKNKQCEFTEKALYSEKIPSIFYFFYKTDLKELKTIFDNCKNFHSLTKELNKRILIFNKQLQTSLASSDVAIISDYIKCFRKDEFINSLRAVYSSETKRFRLAASFLNVLSFIDTTNAEHLFNEHFKKSNRQSKRSDILPLSSNSKPPLQIQLESVHGQMNEDEKDLSMDIAKNEKIESSPPIPDITISSEPADSLQNQLQSIHKQILEMTCNAGPSMELAKKYFDNSRSYILNMIHLLNRFVRDSKKGMTKMQISSHVVNMIINGTLAIEQAYTSILAQRKKCKNMEQMSPYLTHDLLDLYNHCEFSGSFAPAKGDEQLLNETNHCEIDSRNIPKIHIPRTNARAKMLLNDAYCFGNDDPDIDLSQLLKESTRYCRDIIMSFTRLQQFLSEKVLSEQYESLHKILIDFSSSFKAHNQHLRLIEERPLNAHLPVLQESLNQIAEKGPHSLSEQDNLHNLEFLTSIHQTEMESFSNENSEVAMIYSRVLQLNQNILEEFLYLILEKQGENPDRRVIDHHLDRLLAKTEYKLDLTLQEKEFLKNGKDIRSMTRYGTEFLKEDKTETSIAKTSKSSRKLSRHKPGKAATTKSDADGFLPVMKSMDKKMENKVKQIHEMILLDCKILNSIFQKLADLPEFKKDFKLK